MINEENDQQFQMLMTSTDALTLQLNNQRLIQQVKLLKSQYKNMHKANLKLQQNLALSNKTNNRKTQQIRTLSNQLINLTKMILQYDQSQQTFQQIIKDFQLQINQKTIFINSLQQTVKSQNSNQNQLDLQNKVEALNIQLASANNKILLETQKATKLKLQCQQIENSLNEKVSQLQKVQYQLQFEKRKTNKYESQIALLNQQAIQNNKNITIYQTKIDQLIKQIQHNSNNKLIFQQFTTLQKSNQEFKKRLEEQQRKFKILQGRYKDLQQINSELILAKNNLQTNLQQSKYSEEQTRQEMEKYRQRLLHKPKVHLYDLKKNIQIYFNELNQNLRADEDMQQKQMKIVIDTERIEIQDILKAFGKLHSLK